MRPCLGSAVCIETLISKNEVCIYGCAWARLMALTLLLDKLKPNIKSHLLESMNNYLNFLNKMKGMNQNNFLLHTLHWLTYQLRFYEVFLKVLLKIWPSNDWSTIFCQTDNGWKIDMFKLRSAFANADFTLHYNNRLRSAFANADLNLHYSNRLRSALANADHNMQYSNRLRSRIHKFVVSQTL